MTARFTKVTTGSIVNDLGYSGAAAWGDYDNDGFLDLFVANINGPNNFLYHNNGDGTFTRITNGIVVNDPANSPPGCDCGSYGCAWGDYDNDGFLDLFVTNEGPPALVPTVVNFLYHNNGDGTFTKITTGSPVNEYSDSWGCAWADYDNDGFPRPVRLPRRRSGQLPLPQQRQQQQLAHGQTDRDRVEPLGHWGQGARQSHHRRGEPLAIAPDQWRQWLGGPQRIAGEFRPRRCYEH